MEHTTLLKNLRWTEKKMSTKQPGTFTESKWEQRFHRACTSGESSFLHHRKGEEEGKRAPFTSSPSTDFYQIYFPTTHSSLGMKALLFSRDSHSLFSHLAARTLLPFATLVSRELFSPQVTSRVCKTDTCFHRVAYYFCEPTHVPFFLKTRPIRGKTTPQHYVVGRRPYTGRENLRTSAPPVHNDTTILARLVQS